MYLSFFVTRGPIQCGLREAQSVLICACPAARRLDGIAVRRGGGIHCGRWRPETDCVRAQGRTVLWHPCRHQQQSSLKVFKRDTGTDERERSPLQSLLAARGSHAAQALGRAITASVRDAACISRFFRHAAVASASRFCHRQ
jgi:hypothetical protein